MPSCGIGGLCQGQSPGKGFRSFYLSVEGKLDRMDEPRVHALPATEISRANLLKSVSQHHYRTTGRLQTTVFRSPAQTLSPRQSPRPREQDLTPPQAAPGGGSRSPPPLTSALEEVAVDVLYGGVDGRPGGDTSRSDVRVILGIYVLKSFPRNSRMKFWKIPNQSKPNQEHASTFTVLRSNLRKRVQSAHEVEGRAADFP